MLKTFARNNELLSYGMAVLIIAFATYFYHYDTPAAVFWDENYHIASAQKYLAGVMYMEPHPPLGKLFIALGEWLVHPNDALDLGAFTRTDYIKTFPPGYSWAGVRLFPALFGMFSALLFFLILYRIGRAAEPAFLFSALYLFENGFILQSRAAMLESTQIFFLFATILYFLHLLDREKIGYRHAFGFGLLVGLGVMVKANGLILILLFPALFLYRVKWEEGIWKALRRFVLDGAVIVAGMVIVTVAVFYVHFALGTEAAEKHYSASPEYLELIREQETANPLHFPLMLRDNFTYMKNYSKGVPRYNPCKKGENGSLAATWPFMNKTINYRWAKQGGEVRYLYLIGNPVVWFSVVLAVILGAVLVLGHYIFGLAVTDRRLFFLVATFGTLYLSYMITMFNIERVMYLYHYFIPLFTGTLLLFTLFVYLFKGPLERRDRLLMGGMLLFAAEIAYAYWFFSPLTYYKPLGTMEFIQRQWFDFWHLEPVL